MVRFFRNCIHYFWIILVLILITTTLFYLVVIRNDPSSYKSETTLLVSRQIEMDENLNTYEVLQAVQVSERLVFDLPGIIFSTGVLNAVNQNLNAAGIDAETYSMNSLRNQVTTEILTNTRIVEVAVVTDNPEKSQLVAQTIAQSAKEIVFDLYRQDYVKIIKEAELPVSPSGISIRVLWMLGISGGVFIGILAVLIITIAQKNGIDVDQPFAQVKHLAKSPMKRFYSGSLKIFKLSK